MLAPMRASMRDASRERPLPSLEQPGAFGDGPDPLIVLDARGIRWPEVEDRGPKLNDRPFRSSSRRMPESTGVMNMER
jgi:hypothetical protein